MVTAQGAATKKTGEHSDTHQSILIYCFPSGHTTTAAETMQFLLAAQNGSIGCSCGHHGEVH